MENVRDQVELEVAVDENDAIFDERESHEDGNANNTPRGPFRRGNGKLNHREDGGRDPLREGDARPKNTLYHSEEMEGCGLKRPREDLEDREIVEAENSMLI